MPARAAPRRHTYTHLGHTSSSSSFSSPCAVLCASFHPPPSSWNLEQVCSLADYCGPLSNSRHVKAIPGILLIVMQSRPRGKPNGIIILSRSRQCRGDCAADAPSVLFPLTHVTYATPRGLLVCRRGDGCATRRRSLEFSARSKRSIAHDTRASTQWRRRGCSKMSRMSEGLEIERWKN